MNKVISIHLRGIAFQLEENGYAALRAYLDQAERQLANNPDKAEILADIEQAIADKFRALLTTSRNVVLGSEVQAVINEMGPVTDDATTNANRQSADTDNAAKSDSATRSTGPGASTDQPKRLYRLKDGAMIAGVCNGLAAYLGVDVTFLRLIVAILIFFSFGTVAIAYLVCTIIIPQAQTPEERAAATGPSPTAQEFIRRAKDGYYEGFRTFGDRKAHRVWKKKFKHEMREWSDRLKREHCWNWGNTPPPAPAVPPTCAIPPTPNAPQGAFVMLPLLATVKALLFFFFAVIVISLIANGTLLGLALPGHLPVWAGIILALVAYKVVVAPIKALKRTYYYRLNGWPACWNPLAELWHGLLTLAILAFCILLADWCIPGFHNALMNLPAFCHHAADAIRQWWTPQ